MSPARVKGQRRTKWYGWRLSLPDFRDYEATDERLGVVAPVHLPPAFDLLSTGCVPAVKDQGQLGSCVSNTIASLAEFDAAKQGLAVTPLSRLFLYWYGRQMEHDGVDADSGLEVRTGVKVLNTLGAPAEALWPYQIHQFATQPPAAAKRDAKHHCGRQYLRVRQDVAAIKRALIRGFPVTFGFTVYDSFESDAVTRTGLAPMPKAGESALGGHCVYAIGWDDAKAVDPTQPHGGFRFRNHWSADWGAAGDFWLPYAYVENPNLAGDLWVIKRVADVAAPAAAPVAPPAPASPAPPPPPVVAAPPARRGLLDWFRAPHA